MSTTHCTYGETKQIAKSVAAQLAKPGHFSLMYVEGEPAAKIDPRTVHNMIAKALGFGNHHNMKKALEGKKPAAKKADQSQTPRDMPITSIPMSEEDIYNAIRENKELDFSIVIKACAMSFFSHDNDWVDENVFGGFASPVELEFDIVGHDKESGLQYISISGAIDKDDFFWDHFSDNTEEPYWVAEWLHLSEQEQNDLIEWYNVRPEDIDNEDRAKLAKLKAESVFEAWECPNCGDRVFHAEPEDWADFQGVQGQDFSSYPGNSDHPNNDKLCDTCRIKLI